MGRAPMMQPAPACRCACKPTQAHTCIHMHTCALGSACTYNPQQNGPPSHYHADWFPVFHRTCNKYGCVASAALSARGLSTALGTGAQPYRSSCATPPWGPSLKSPATTTLHASGGSPCDCWWRDMEARAPRAWARRSTLRSGLPSRWQLATYTTWVRACMAGVWWCGGRSRGLVRSRARPSNWPLRQY